MIIHLEILLLASKKSHHLKPSFGRDQHRISEVGSGIKLSLSGSQLWVENIKVTFVLDNAQQGTIFVTFSEIDGCLFSNIVMSPTGEIKYMCFQKGKGWYPTWKALESECDIYGACGKHKIN